jgi:hypothetical protein
VDCVVLRSTNANRVTGDHHQDGRQTYRHAPFQCFSPRVQARPVCSREQCSSTGVRQHEQLFSIPKRNRGSS